MQQCQDPAELETSLSLWTRADSQLISIDDDDDDDAAAFELSDTSISQIPLVMHIRQVTTASSTGGYGARVSPNIFAAHLGQMSIKRKEACKIATGSEKETNAAVHKRLDRSS
ncbi:hypothetical protein ABZP36_001341 [Zizania latifolia]